MAIQPNAPIDSLIPDKWLNNWLVRFFSRKAFLSRKEKLINLSNIKQKYIMMIFLDFRSRFLVFVNVL